MTTAARSLMRSPALLVLALAHSAPSLGQQPALPDTVGTWVRTAEVRTYEGEDLFLLVDGGADLFFEYGFRRALACTYSAASSGPIAVELYEMDDSRSAFGLFSSFARGSTDTTVVGAEAVLGEGYLLFWEGTRVGMLSTSDTGGGSGENLLRIAHAVAGRVENTAAVPALCRKLSDMGYPRRSMVYVKGRIALSTALPYACIDALPDAEGAAGERAGCHYLILEYADSAGAEHALQSAGAGWQRMRGLVVQDSAGGRTLRRSGEGSARLETWGCFVIGVAGGVDAVQQELLAELRAAAGR